MRGDSGRRHLEVREEQVVGKPESLEEAKMDSPIGFRKSTLCQLLYFGLQCLELCGMRGKISSVVLSCLVCGNLNCYDSPGKQYII